MHLPALASSLLQADEATPPSLHTKATACLHRGETGVVASRVSRTPAAPEAHCPICAWAEPPESHSRSLQGRGGGGSLRTHNSPDSCLSPRDNPAALLSLP